MWNATMWLVSILLVFFLDHNLGFVMKYLDFDLRNYQLLSPGYPTSGSHGGRESSHLAMDGLRGECLQLI